MKESYKATSRGRGDTLLNLQKQSLKQAFIQRRFWFQFGGIGRMFSTSNSLILNSTIDSDVCCDQLKKLKPAVKEKSSSLANRKGVVS